MELPLAHCAGTDGCLLNADACWQGRRGMTVSGRGRELTLHVHAKNTTCTTSATTQYQPMSAHSERQIKAADRAAAGASSCSVHSTWLMWSRRKQVEQALTNHGHKCKHGHDCCDDQVQRHKLIPPAGPSRLFSAIAFHPGDTMQDVAQHAQHAQWPRRATC